MEIRLIIFDLAGTTVKDFNYVPDALVQAFYLEGIEVSYGEANFVMGIPKPEAISQLLSKKMASSNITTELIDKIHASFLNRIIRFYKESEDVEEKEGVSATFKILKERGIKIAIDTGFDRATTEVLLERVGWRSRGWIDAVVTSDEVAKGRPYPDMIFKIMEITGISDTKTVGKVGDTVYDLEEGNNAGCGLVVGVTTGAFSKEQLMKSKYDYLVEEIPELLDILMPERKGVKDKSSAL
jgi:phosphonatase-like hydrolase